MRYRAPARDDKDSFWQNNYDGYYIPQNADGNRQRKLIWWDNEGRQISILAVAELNTDTTIQTLAASAKAYNEGGK